MRRKDGRAELLLHLCQRPAEAGDDPSLIPRLERPGFRRDFLQLGSDLRVEGLALSRLEKHPTLRSLAPGVVEAALAPLPPLRERASRQTAELIRLVSLLREGGIDPLVQKGPALREAVYDDPVERWCGDLDLLVEPGAFETALARARSAGYELPYSSAVFEGYRRHHFHVLLRHPEGFVVELHWGLHGPRSAFRLDPGAFLARSRPGGGGEAIRIPCPEHLLVQSAQGNLRNDFRTLQYLVDVDRIVARFPDLDWDLAVQTARDGGLASLLWLSLRLATALFGTDVPERVTRSLEPGRVAKLHLTGLRPVSRWEGPPESADALSDLLQLWLIDRETDRALHLARHLTGDEGDLVWLFAWEDEPSRPLTRLATRLRRLTKLLGHEALFCWRQLRA